MTTLTFSYRVPIEVWCVYVWFLSTKKTSFMPLWVLISPGDVKTFGVTCLQKDIQFTKIYTSISRENGWGKGRVDGTFRISKRFCRARQNGYFHRQRGRNRGQWNFLTIQKLRLTPASLGTLFQRLICFLCYAVRRVGIFPTFFVRSSEFVFRKGWLWRFTIVVKNSVWVNALAIQWVCESVNQWVSGVLDGV